MIWIIGNRGMLGKELSRYFDEAGVPHAGSDREVSILDPSALGRFANKHTPDWIVNCSAYTVVDKAEEEESTAFALNRDGPANIAEAAADLNVPLIHISTDYVFDGSSAEPLPEVAPTAPQSVYGRSKLAGEEAVRRITERHFILRTAWLYGEFGSNFVYTMLKLMESRDSIKVVDDQRGSPTWARELARLIASIVGSKSTAYGTYHFSGEGECSWYAFAREIYRHGREKGILSSECEIIPCPSSEFPTPARRPRYSLLSKEKVKRAFGIEISDWKDSLADFYERFVSIHNKIATWYEHADYDLQTGKAMHESGRYLYVAITCQQCIEKNLKALCEYQGKEIPRIHDLLRLWVYLFSEQSLSNKQLLKDLSYYYIAARYGERIKRLSSDLNKSRSEYLLDQTEEIARWIQSKIPFGAPSLNSQRD